ncbi:MAG: response regulator [Alphaproteobacteria bacterium]|jgi:CheY-like chemotaxis protein|nr:response regulator [Alphaproteobacteria bacterium]MDP6516933.1 response regulator [Alphaproteobacteria bacterium]|tara:strand:- start:11 stop:388 length:378 start_codon:yes stop_codon:yes gene_type:complete
MSPLNLLGIDDDRDFLDGLADLLEMQGYDTAPAVSGEEGIVKAESGDFDLMFMDMMMPGLNGADLYAELKAMGRPPPTLVVTAYRREEAENLARLRVEPIEGWPIKPFEPEELVRLLATIAQEEA